MNIANCMLISLLISDKLTLPQTIVFNSCYEDAYIPEVPIQDKLHILPVKNLWILDFCIVWELVGRGGGREANLLVFIFRNTWTYNIQTNVNIKVIDLRDKTLCYYLLAIPFPLTFKLTLERTIEQQTELGW